MVTLLVSLVVFLPHPSDYHYYYHIFFSNILFAFILGGGGEGWEFLWININKNIINLSRFNASIGSGFWFLCHVTIIISFYFLMGRFFLSFLINLLSICCHLNVFFGGGSVSSDLIGLTVIGAVSALDGSTSRTHALRAKY